MSQAGFKHAIFRTVANASDRLTTLTDDDLCSKVIHDHGVRIKSTYDNTCIKLIITMV